MEKLATALPDTGTLNTVKRRVSQTLDKPKLSNAPDDLFSHPSPNITFDADLVKKLIEMGTNQEIVPFVMIMEILQQACAAFQSQPNFRTLSVLNTHRVTVVGLFLCALCWNIHVELHYL